MLLSNDTVNRDVRDVLVYKVIVDLLKDRETDVGKAVETQVKALGLRSKMTQNDYDEVMNRAMIAFVSIRGYIPKSRIGR